MKVVGEGIAADDFHFYALLRPNIKTTMHALGSDVTTGLYHPVMTFNQKALVRSSIHCFFALTGDCKTGNIRKMM